MGSGMVTRQVAPDCDSVTDRVAEPLAWPESRKTGRAMAVMRAWKPRGAEASKGESMAASWL